MRRIILNTGRQDDFRLIPVGNFFINDQIHDEVSMQDLGKKFSFKFMSQREVWYSVDERKMYFDKWELRRQYRPEDPITQGYELTIEHRGETLLFYMLASRHVSAWKDMLLKEREEPKYGSCYTFESRLLMNKEGHEAYTIGMTTGAWAVDLEPKDLPITTPVERYMAL